MKFLHLGDIHLGKSVNEFSMLEDQAYILNQILDIAREQSVDAILIAGDIYDKSVPSEGAVALFDSFLNQVSEAGISLIAISGNHDSDERLQYGSKLFESNHIYITGKYTGTVPQVTLEDDHGPVHFYMMPFVKASLVRHFYEEDDTSTYDAALRTVLAHMDVDEKERNVILAHQFVTGGDADPELAGSEKAVLNVGTIDKVHYSCFDAFDYVALGHIHSGQKIGRDTCRYSGSPLKYSLKEIHHVKSVPVVTLLEKGNVEIELIELKPRREMRKIQGPLLELISEKNVCDSDDYIYAVLTDETMQYDAMRRLQEVYPNTMKLDYANVNQHGAASDDMYDTENKSFQELMGDFYQLILGTEPTDEEWAILNDVAREAGVLE